MIHVDVRTATLSPVNNTPAIVVEVSQDGGGWKRLISWPIYNQSYDQNASALKTDAEHWARAWIDGARYAGAEVRATSHGYNLA